MAVASGNNWSTILRQEEQVDRIFAEVVKFLTGVHGMLLALQDDPDEASIDQALRTLSMLRRMLKDEGPELRRRAMRLRDDLVAHVTSAAPNLKMDVIAEAAGYTDSMASRVSRARGVQPRARRPGRTGTG